MYPSSTNNIKILLPVILCCLIGWSSSAHADQQKDYDEAVGKAQTAFGEARYDDAIRFLKSANYIKADPLILLNIARSYEKLDNCVQSIIYLRSFTQDPDAPQDYMANTKKKLRSAKRSCKAYTDDLSGRLVIEALPAGAAVKLNNIKLGVTPLETSGLKPGKYTLEITSKDHKPFKTKIAIAKGQTDKLLRYKLEKASANSVVVEKKDDKKIVKKGGGTIIKDKKTTSKDKGLNIPAVAMLGVGTVALGAALYIDHVRMPDYDEQLKKEGITVDEFNSLRDSRQTEATIALVSYIAGGVLIASGATWLVVDLISDDKEDEVAAPSATLAPAWSPGFAGVNVVGRF